MTLHRIDVHHHLIPPVFKNAMERYGIHEVAGAPLPKWTPQDSIEVMDACGTRTALLSLSAPGVNFGTLSETVKLARLCNEYASELSQKHAGRFGYFAVLPMPFTEEACKEACYALDHLGAVGVVLLGSTDGVFLGDSALEELMAELNRRKAVVFVHPNLHASSQSLGLNMPGFLMEFLCDTTRASLNLVLTGVLERYPDIRWILAHAGGFLPYIAWRASLANFMPEFVNAAPQGVMHYIKRFYFDTALSPSPFAMPALKELVGAQQVLFGSDFPFAPAIASHLQVKTLDNLDVWNAQERAMINYENAINLFPSLAASGDVVRKLPEYQRETQAGKLARMLRSPIINLAERMRKR